MQHPSKALLSLPLLLLLSTAASGQNLYRCGSTFSQTPCGNETAPARKLPSAAASGASAPAASGKELCERTLLNDGTLPDPYSAKIRTLRDKTEVIQYAGQAVAAVRYNLHVNARNSAGAYTGERLYACHLSPDGFRVLQMSQPNQ